MKNNEHYSDLSRSSTNFGSYNSSQRTGFNQERATQTCDKFQMLFYMFPDESRSFQPEFQQKYSKKDVC